MATPTTAPTESKINSNYGAELSSRGQKYPAIQPDIRKVESIKTVVNLCLNDTSLGLLSENAAKYFGSNPKTVCFDGENDQTVYVIPDGIRWVVMGFPQTFMQKKSDSADIRPLQKGFKLAENNFKAATKILMAAIVDDGFILNSDGAIQLFTLKLTSSKTKLTKNVDPKDKEYRCLTRLNDTLIKRDNLPKQSWIHCVSVDIGTETRKFTSASAGDSSFGYLYTLVGGARNLPDALAKQSFMLSQSNEVKSFLKDPFNVYKSKDGDANSAEDEDLGYGDEEF
jgi:hypothetical protein